MNKVIVYEDESCEMRKIVIDGKTIKSGNYWDFDPIDTLEAVLKTFNIDVIQKDYKYE